MATWYLGSNKHALIAQWAATTAYVVGDIVRQLAAPSVNNERAFRCTTAGTSGGAEPSWTLTKGGTTNDGTAVWTEVTGNSAYGWAAAAARQRLFMDGASSWAAAGDTIYRHSSHAETQSTSITLTSPGTAASPIRCLTVNDGVTALATGATVNATGNSSISFLGFTYDYGVTYVMGSGGTLAVNANFTSGSPNWWRLEDGGFTFSSTGAATIAISTNASGLDDRLVEFINCTVSFNTTGSGFGISGKLRWIGGSVTGAAAPTTLFTNLTTGPGAILEGYGLDLSALGSGKTLFAMQQGQMCDFLLENCKLGASVAYSSGSVAGQGGAKLRIVNCDSGATNYNYHGQDYAGTITSESVIKYLADTSRKMVSTANAKKNFPLVLDDIVIYNTVTGSAQTATVEIVTDNVTLTDAECWLEVEYLGNASFPISSFADDKISDDEFGTPANQTSSSVAWTTTGLTTPVKQKLTVSFTAQTVGVVKLRVMLAKASTTVYVDPQATIA